MGEQQHSTTHERDPFGQIEDENTLILGALCALQGVLESETTDTQDRAEALDYLVNRLREHHEAQSQAINAFIERRVANKEARS